MGHSCSKESNQSHWRRRRAGWMPAGPTITQGGILRAARGPTAHGPHGSRWAACSLENGGKTGPAADWLPTAAPLSLTAPIQIESIHARVGLSHSRRAFGSNDICMAWMHGLEIRCRHPLTYWYKSPPFRSSRAAKLGPNRQTPSKRPLAAPPPPGEKTTNCQQRARTTRRRRLTLLSFAPPPHNRNRPTHEH